MADDRNLEENRAANFALPVGPNLPVSSAWVRWRERADLNAYDVRWDQMEADGHSVHDEAVFVDELGGQVILDAGCGAGRVAVELARRGRQVVGVDADADMLAYARRKPEAVRWEHADLSSMALPEWFDTVVMAGNILVFVEPSLRSEAVANTARHLKLDGHLVMGSSNAEDCLFGDADQWCSEAGLALVDQFSTWNRQPFDDGDYRVSVHRRVR